LTAKITPIPDSSATREELLAEITRLRANVGSLEVRIQGDLSLFSSLSRGLELGLWEWDEVNDQPIYLSPELAILFGIDPGLMSQTIHKSSDFDQFVYAQDLKFFQGQRSNFLQMQGEEGIIHSYEYRVKRPNGDLVNIREAEYGIFDEAGTLIKSYGVIQDITEFVRAISSSKQSEERFATLFEDVPLGIQEEDYSVIKRAVDKLVYRGQDDIASYFRQHPNLLKNLVSNTSIIAVNNALLRLHKSDTNQEFLEVENDIDEWWDQDWVDFYAEEIGALLKGVPYYEAERIDTRIDGSFFETRSITTIVRGYEDSWARVITIHEDITDRKRAEAAILEAKTGAEKASNAKSEFLSSMSHELRTPMNAIIGFSQLFEYDPLLNENQMSNAREINRAGKHLLNLIDQILDLSRIEAGEFAVKQEKVALASIFDECLAWVKSIADSQSIKIQFNRFDFIGVLVEGDGIRLKQVFLNLLTNAIKYNCQGGEVAISLTLISNEKLLINVKDTGPGIAAEKLGELFQPFNRLGAESSGIEGTGIGLVITRQLVELMQGRLLVKSEIDSGSTFSVELKRADISPVEDKHLVIAVNEISESDAVQQYGKPRILVAEDNPVNRELMRAQLQALEYQADFAENGHIAFEIWKVKQHDILLTDIRMPEMDGLSLIRAVRENNVLTETSTQIIAISANAMEEDIQQCMEAGADEVLPKPVELELLKLKLDAWQSPLVTLDILLSDKVEAIDLSVLVRSVGQKPEVHFKLLKDFAEYLTEFLDNIENAFAWKKTNQLIESTHKLKSSARSLGAIQLGDICEVIENAGKQNNWGDIENFIPKLRERIEQVEQSIKAMGGGPPMAGTRQALPNLDHSNIDVGNIRILLVDDDPVLHRVTRFMLNDLGVHQILNALSGMEGLDRIRNSSQPFDVIICDLNMPGMDGVEFIRHLSQLKFSGGLILSSGEDERIVRTVEKLAIEHELQMLGTLQKPLNKSRLVTVLDNLNRDEDNRTLFNNQTVTIAELIDAIETRVIDTWFQPKVDIKTGKIVGVEALARWNHPLKGMIRPDVFIPLAEEHNLIMTLTELVSQIALDYAANLRREGFELNVAINISVDALKTLDWPDKMAREIEAVNLSASEITLEITESRLMEHLSVALDILSRLSLKRFNLSIDDFGTGYSSMEQLQRIPFSEFKIDRAFVHGANNDNSARAILESSVLLARNLGMKIVAEGVEDQADWDLVESLGCDQVQGYFICKPQPFPDLLVWLANWKGVCIQK
jgi:EAL domain-containing protein (putative c-di-GMP-specific phosphodiesterase class I)/signal transduction histidine kinase/DNA-binding response OmpR family regulator/HPt (histidine-containing phosphotransfer) domain-containing protein